jgi:hypothetical protein
MPKPDRPAAEALNRFLTGVGRGAALGLLAGGFEVAAASQGTRLPLEPGAFFLFGVVSALAASVLGAAAAALAAPTLYLVRPHQPHAAPAWHIGLTAALLGWFYLSPSAWAGWRDGQHVAAVALAVMPVALIGVVWFNASYWLRRADAGVPVPGWGRSAAAGTISLITLGTLVAALRDTGGLDAIDGERSLVLVTIGGATPSALDAIRDSSVTFSDAVSPTPDPVAAVATMLTSLHPIRHRALDATTQLPRGFTTVTERLAAFGWATGAFVGNLGFDRGTGLDQGFLTYDDDMATMPGLWSGRVAEAIAWLKPDLAPVRRSDAATVASFARWFRAHEDVPKFAWVHLNEGSIEPLTQALTEAGAALSLVAVALPDAAGTPLSEASVRAGLAVRAPDLPPTTVTSTVRLTDVGNTILEILRLDPDESVEGAALGPWMRRERDLGMSTSLIATTPDGTWVGLRSAGVTYLRAPDGREQLLDLTQSPPEDRAGTDAEGLEQARGLVAPERLALDKARARALPRPGREAVLAQLRKELPR